MRTSLTLVCLGLMSACAVSAQVIRVPADQPTIQAGIMAAAKGDVVLVAEGTYYENINFMGKAITVASEYYLDQDERHIRRTIIDGSRPANPDIGSVVSFVSGEDTTSVLCGFTITGGTGTLELFPGFPPIRAGGGICCVASGARITHNRIVANVVQGTPWAFGAGFQSGPPFLPAFVILEENLFENNTARADLDARGGAISMGCSARIMNNVIKHNTAYAAAEGAAGGGIEASSFPGAPNVVVIFGNVIAHNQALQGDNAEYWLGGVGGGISIALSTGVIANNIIQHNTVSAAHSSFGPGVLLDFPPDDVVFKNNLVSHNTYSGAGSCYGGGFAVWDGSPTIENNVIEKNKATFGGGGWIGDTFSSTRMMNNTIAENHADASGGAIHTKSATPSVLNSILWRNKAPEGPEIFVESGTIDVSYCDVEGGWTGTGNIDANPNFIREHYLLGRWSPCIDAGHPGDMYRDPENPAKPGRAALPARGSVRNDMGAYGGPASADWRDVLGKPFIEGEDAPSAGMLPRGLEISNYPNPFNAQTAIRVHVPADGFVRLRIFNLLGQEVATLASGSLSAGTHTYLWNANNVASGVYMYRVESAGEVLDGRMILMK